LPVYVDVWQHRSDPMAAINYGLQEAIDNIEVPGSTVGKRLKTKVNKVRIGLASIDVALSGAAVLEWIPRRSIPQSLARSHTVTGMLVLPSAEAGILYDSTSPLSW
jgi:hypothetical protein